MIKSHGTTTAIAVTANNGNLENFAFSLSLHRSRMLAIMIMPATKIWYFARKPKPKARPLRINAFFWSKRIQVKKKNMVSEKKNISIVSSNAKFETQKKPGIDPSRMLEINAIFGPYVRQANSNTIHTERSANVTAANLPAKTLIPNTLK